MAAPTCGHVVLTCMDFRFVQPLRRYLDDAGVTGDADLIAWPGGAACLALDAERDRAIEAIALARDLHRCERAILVAHEDCRRLGGSAAHGGPAAERPALIRHLRDAVEVLRDAVPEIVPRPLLLTASGDAIVVDA